MTTTKEKQIRRVIEETLRRFKVAILMHDVGLSGYSKQDPVIDRYADELLREVSIRTPLK